MIPEAGPASQDPSSVKKLVFCTGKVYYDINKARIERKLESDVAVARVEQVCSNPLPNSGSFSFGIFQISPFPFDLVKKECAKYPNAQLCWAQEEHKNQGAWSYVQPRFNTALNKSRDVRWELFLNLDLWVIPIYM